MRTVDHAVVLRVAGDIDLLTGSQLRQALDRAHNAAHHKLIVDLTDVDFMGSAGVAALVAIHENDNPTPMIIVADHIGSPHRVLEITGLLNVLTMTTTVDKALLHGRN
ncbi:hypothetical protein GCM10010483_48660 [Actinokineospora diospyrosa]